MSSSPVRIQPRRSPRPPQAGSEQPSREETVVTSASNRPSRGEAVATVARSILLVVAAVSVIATSNYFAYLIGRKQATVEELRKQVERVVQLIDERQNDEETAPPLKQQRERLAPNASGPTGLTTSTINGKTTAVAPEPAPAERPIPAALSNPATVEPPTPDVRLRPPDVSPENIAKPRDMHGDAHQRSPRRQKISRTAPRQEPAEAGFGEQWSQSTNAAPATRDLGLNGQ